MKFPNWLCNFFLKDENREHRRRIQEVNEIIGLCRSFLKYSHNYAILDSETTGLGEKDIIIQIGIIDLEGNELMNTYVRSIKNKRIPSEATAIHGIKSSDLRMAPLFKDLIEDLYDLSKKRTFLIFNAEFDYRLFLQTCDYNNLRSFDINALCIQKLYSIYVGEWSDYFNDYKKQSLPNSTHNVKSDCMATLKLIKDIANVEFYPEPYEKYTIFGIQIN